MRDFFIALLVVIALASFIVAKKADEAQSHRPAHCETSADC